MTGPPPLRPFGLRLHHDGRWSHEGQPILNRRLREHFDRSVRYLPDEGKYVVTLRHFRGEVEVEEAGFFVRALDLPEGVVHLSDQTRERFRPETLRLSPIDGALLCLVKQPLAPPWGVPARLDHSVQAELLLALEEGRNGHVGLPLDSGVVWIPLERIGER
ncbi:MAG: hypothetical protein QNK05_10060 [Myxococcota bacterium]|nr:hypothetical protein [Myxococcota bacterium]